MLVTPTSGVASADADIALFRELIPAISCGNSEGNGVVAVAVIGVRWILNGAIDDAIVVEVPGPGSHVS